MQQTSKRIRMSQNKKSKIPVLPFDFFRFKSSLSTVSSVQWMCFEGFFSFFSLSLRVADTTVEELEMELSSVDNVVSVVLARVVLVEVERD